MAGLAIAAVAELVPGVGDGASSEAAALAQSQADAALALAVVAQSDTAVAQGNVLDALAECGCEGAAAGASGISHGEVAPVAPDAVELPLEPSGDGSSEGPKTVRPSMRLKAINVLGYESEEQIQRHKALMRMGLCEEDIYMSAPFFRPHDKLERLRELYRKRGYSEKLLDLLGMTEEQILRRKALTMLGTTEQEIEDDRVRRLVALGIQYSPRFQPPAEYSCINK
jgi:hypothetical protein